MVKSIRGWLIVLLVLAMIRLHAQQAVATPTPDPCSNTPAPTQMFELTAASGTPEPLTQNFHYTLKNDTDVLIRLKNINPFAFKCTVTTSSNAFKETAVSSFVGLLGGVTGNLGVTTPDPAPAPKATATPPAAIPGAPGTQPRTAATCQSDYLPMHQKLVLLKAYRDAINQALYATRDKQDQILLEFTRRVTALSSQPECTKIVEQANGIATWSGFQLVDVQVPSEGIQPSANSLPLAQAIDDLAARAEKLSQTLTEGLTQACKVELKSTTDQDQAFLSALINSTASTPSAVTTWSNQIKAFNTVRSNLVVAQGNIISVLRDRQNFTIDTPIHGHQSVVSYTATCTRVAAPTIVLADAAAPAPTPAPSPSPTPTGGGSWPHEFKFGIGPFFVLAGGLVVSPLQQITFSTTTTTGGSGNTANTVIEQQNSSTRILPIAMLHARYVDLLPVEKWAWLPSYISVGVTAKSSDNKGTNIEYLFGPSWAFADRQLFVTAGTYAGQQQRLTGGLAVGGTTALGGANLPITLTTIWKVGFAITWAPGGK